jgi:hypothetical protein
MDWKAIVGSALAAGALVAPAPALAQGSYRLRNDTRQTQNCRLDRPHRTVSDRFVLRPGAEWSQAAQGSVPRRLVCDVGPEPLQTVIRPGPLYALVVDAQSGRVVARIVPAR